MVPRLSLQYKCLQIASTARLQPLNVSLNMQLHACEG